ncbi:type II secretion system inner membrane protein GspF [Spartinivicinus poritis]|uniref:General secretion pathway protein F n=1 Tax=Spartinivicinus poritis TaxID=2994640 RepID=A0ABT5UBU0_9GAMM|nr:type II secretion system inner membrane protein GspF [Spartinivicinus sp. A2-2]MDE1463849.1 type II secretion system inner membrane protein GspF [Spartinivicinus sp. A2-2]
MAAFEYIALTQAGKEQKGVIEGDSIKQVRQLLRDKQLAPMQVTPAKGKAQSSSSVGFSVQRSHRISVHELALFTRQLATLIQAGMPLEECLRAVGEQSGKNKIKSMVMSVRAKVLEGYSLADSLAEYPNVFPKLYRATVSAGEHAGHLNLVLTRLADYTEARHKSRQKIKMALMYPIILLTASLLIVGFLLGYVVPDIVKVFINSNQELPGLTQVIIAASDMVKASWHIILLVVITLVIGVKQGMKFDGFRYKVHRFNLMLPLIGNLTKNTETARFISTLSILSKSGVPLVDGLRIAVEVVSNEVLKAKVSNTAQVVSEGASLRAALEQTGIFAPMVVHMVASGESSGELDEMLARAAENQEQELEGFVTMLVGLFEPFMLLFMGAVVLIIVLAVLLPILNLNQLVM